MEQIQGRNSPCSVTTAGAECSPWPRQIAEEIGDQAAAVREGRRASATVAIATKASAISAADDGSGTARPSDAGASNDVPCGAFRKLMIKSASSGPSA